MKWGEESRIQNPEFRIQGTAEYEGDEEYEESAAAR
jgi:hypothetical protein